MRAAILYTVVSLVNLIAFAVGILFLPAQVPIHFNAALTADAMGSPWVYLSLPGAAALISAGIWAALFQKKNRAVTVGVLTVAGIVFLRPRLRRRRVRRAGDLSHRARHRAADLPSACLVRSIAAPP